MIDEKICPDYGLQPLWNELLDIYGVFAAICDKHNLRYYGFAGTALGAVRHKGFIPWDDDLDVAMPRPDFEKFMRIAQDELPTHLRLATWRNTPEFSFMIAKVHDVRRGRVCALEKQLGRTLSNGVFIDIFPLDGYPTGFRRIWTRMRLLVLALLWVRHVIGGRNLSWRMKMEWLASLAVAPLFPSLRTKRTLMEKYEALLLETPFDAASEVGCVCHVRNIFLRPPVPGDSWNGRMESPFEDRTIVLPEKIDAHLRSNYGADYMRLPPPELRKPTHALEKHLPWWLGPTTDLAAY